MDRLVKATGILLLVITLVLLAGCESVEVETGEAPDAAFISGRTDVRVLPESGETWVVSPPLLPEGRWGYQVSLIARWPGEPDGPPQFEVYFFSKRIEWAFFDQVLSADGESLEVVVNERQVGGPQSYEERVTARLSNELIMAGEDDGLRLVFRGRGGQQVVEIPAFFIEGFLERVERVAGSPRPREAG